jgi:dolichol-phosphate mannosyltransferase
MKHSVDVISSALNEEDAILELYERLNKVFSEEHNYSWKLIIFDNGSIDSTWEKILQISSNHLNVVGYRMSRTFSLDAAFTAGLHQATADLAIIMASDLQDPPEVISSLLRKWETGTPHVVVRITKRAELSYFKNRMTKAFYRITNWASDGMIPENVSDFRLMDRKVYSAVNEIKERNRFMRGLIAWTGFPTEFIEIERPRRTTGITKASYLQLIRFAFQSILASSEKPIKYISTAGFCLSGLSLFSIVVFSILWILTGVPFAGYGSIVALIFLTFSLTIGVLGVIAEYISLIYIEVKSRPNSIIWESTLER